MIYLRALLTASFACVALSCGGDDNTTPDGAADRTVADTFKPDTMMPMDTGIKDTGGMDTGSGMDGGTGMDAAPDSGVILNPCWLDAGSTAICGACCSVQTDAGHAAWVSTGEQACMCMNPACGNNGTCGGNNNLCQNNGYSTNCKTCLQQKLNADGGPCPAAYTQCQADQACKAWTACLLGCP